MSGLFKAVDRRSTIQGAGIPISSKVAGSIMLVQGASGARVLLTEAR